MAPSLSFPLPSDITQQQWKSFAIEHKLGQSALHESCQSHQIAPEQLFQAAWATVVAAYDHDEDVYADITVRGQGASKACLCHFTVTPSQSIRDVLTTVTATDGGIPPSPGHWSSLEYVHSGSDVAPTKRPRREEHITMRLVLCEDDSTLRVQHRQAAMGSDRARSMAHGLVQVITQAMHNPDVKVKDLDLISQIDLNTILQWNDYPLHLVDACVHEIIQQRACERPDSLAIRAWDDDLTYSRLDDLASRLALHLRLCGVKVGDVVPFLFSKSAWAVVASLATLKAGAAAVALSPDHPLARSEAIIRHTQASHILVSREHHGLADSLRLRTTIVVARDLFPNLPANSTELPAAAAVRPQDPAFIQFTSGSTGEPKGIILEHRGFCTSAAGQQKSQNMTQASRVLQFAAYTFDAALQETFTTLMAGGVVCIPSERDRTSRLAAAMREMEVNWAFFTPTLCATLQPSSVPCLRTLVLGGEAPSPELIRTWSSRVSLLNGYGPSECCICCSVHPVSSNGSDSPLNIGVAIPGVKLWIVRPENHAILAPLGAIGELVAQGPNLARGYLDASSATSLNFVNEVPWSTDQCFRRVYKTGDLVRYLADGSIEFVGRKDTQIKLRGQRVEPGEIASHVRTHLGRSDVQVAVDVAPVSLRGTPTQQLLAFFAMPPAALEGSKVSLDIVPRLPPRCGRLTPSLNDQLLALKDSLGTTLPRHMVPALFVPVTYLPVSLAGKLDRKMLRALVADLSETEILEYSLASPGTRQGARDSREAILVRAWSEALRVPPQDINVTDEFFLLGDSIAAIELTTVLRSRGFHLTVADIFQHPRLESQALILAELVGDQYQEAKPFSLVEGIGAQDLEAMLRLSEVPLGDLDDLLPSTRRQEALFLSQTELPSRLSQVVLELDHAVGIPEFRLAWLAVVKRSSILRTRLVADGQGGLLQAVAKQLPPWEDISSLHDHLADPRFSGPWRNGQPLVHFALRQGDGRCRKSAFVLSIHPALIDWVALQLLLDQFQNEYRQLTGGLAMPYSRYVEHLTQADHAASAMFWMSELSEPNYLHYPDVPSSVATADQLSRSSLSASLDLPDSLDELRPLDALVHLAWAVVLSSRTLSDDVIFGTARTSRPASIGTLEAVMGPTEAVAPVRVRLTKTDSIQVAVVALQDQLQAITVHSYLNGPQLAGIGPEGEAASHFQNLLVVHPALKTPPDLLTTMEGYPPFLDAGRYHQYPVTVDCTLAAARVELRLSFTEAIVSQAEAQALLRQLQSVLRELLSRPAETTIQNLSLLTADDYAQLVAWNRAAPQPVRETAHGLFTARAQRQPQAVAVESWDGRLTYAELDRYSTHLGRYLLAGGLTPGREVVTVCYEKSRWTLVAMLGILKAGGAFNLMDPSHPSPRLKFIADEVGSRFMLCSPRYATKAAGLAAHPIIVDESFFHGDLPTKQSADLPAVSPDAIMYVFYTSGSTGMPKGHRTPHAAFCSAATAQARALGLSSTTRNFQFASYAYDVCISDMLTGLCAGTCVCVPSEEERLGDIAGAMAQLRVNFANLTPTVARLLDPDRVPALQTLLLGGEALQQTDLDMWSGRVRLMAGYGPSECSPRSTVNPHLTAASNPRNIGFASLCNCRAWVVEVADYHRLRPVGLVGELVIEGPNVCNGYLGHAQQRTDSGFIDTPRWYAELNPTLQPVGRFYKTGDLVRYDLSDGSLIFVGRNDAQVKLHGQRVELGEIESHVRALPLADPTPQSSSDSSSSGVISKVVAELAQPGGLVRTPSLVVFVQFSHPHRGIPDGWAAAVAQHLAVRMSAALVPKYYVALDEIPLMSSGKVNRRALQALPATLTAEQLGLSTATRKEKLRPSSTEEYRLSQLWATVLDVPEAETGRDDHFFELGGDSIAAIKLVGEARRAGFLLTVTDVFQHPVLASMATKLTILAPAAPGMSAPVASPQMTASLADRVSREWNLPRDTIQDVYPATPLQMSLMALTTRNPKTNTLQHVYHLSADVDVMRFRRAWEAVVARNEIFRTRLVFVKASILQVVLADSIAWETTPSSLPEYLARVDDRPFNYGTPLMRLGLLPDGHRGGSYFVWTAHHVVYDGWSHFRTLRLIKETYEADAVPFSIPFRTFIAFLHQAGEDEAQERFWQNELAGFKGTTFPPLPRAEYWPLTDRGIDHVITLCSNLAPQSSSQFANITLSTIIRVAWALTVGIQTGTEDVVFGAVQTGRMAPLAGVVDIMGPTITVVPVRVRWARSLTLGDLLLQVQEQGTRMIPYEHAGVKAIANMGEDCRVAATFQSLLVVQPEKTDGAAATVAGMRLVQVTDREFPSYLLSVQCSIQRNQVRVHASYDSSVLSGEWVQRIVGQFEHLLHLLGDPRNLPTPVGQGEIIPAADVQRLLAQDAATALDRSPVDDTIAWAIERQMKLQPDAPALCEVEGPGMSYGELDRLSARLALHLRTLGVGPEKVVPFCFDKSVWAVVAVVGVLRAGGVCVALDPGHPPSRHAQILQEVQATLVLTSNAHRALFRDQGVPVLAVDRSRLRWLPETVMTGPTCHPQLRPDHAAWVVFTSGSTGTPKGIVLEHASICATARGNASALGVTRHTRVLQFASFAFDVAIEDMCITLMHGACLCIASEHDRLNNLGPTMQQMRVTWADLTPSVARTIEPEAVPSLQTLVLGGELLGDDIISSWANRVNLFNTYGPAECAIYSTTTSPLGLDARGGNIGRPIGCACWVVDPDNHNRLMPVGCTGELLIEGPNLARGYLHDEAKTRRAFVHPTWLAEYRGGQRSRCYATGDLVQQNPDGATLTFVGRKDSQVKLRGQRIELGEIEHQIAVSLAGESWATAVEIIRQAAHRQEALAVFYWPTQATADAPDAAPRVVDDDALEATRAVFLELKAQLARVLPKYMIPTLYVPLSFPPSTRTGKLDRRALRSLGASLSMAQATAFALEGTAGGKVAKVPPQTEMERVLLELWGTVLDLSTEQMGIHDSFFQLGGESVAAIRLVAAAQRMKLAITVADIFHRPVLADMAASLHPETQQQQQQSADEMLSPSPTGADLTARVSRAWKIGYESIEDLYPCTWLQEDMIQVTRRVSEANTLRFIAHLDTATVDLARYQAAWQQVVTENPILRTRIVRVDDDDDDGYDASEDSYRALQVVVDEPIQWCTSYSRLSDYLREDRSTRFDYGTPLTRFALIPHGPDEYYFVFTSHHATYDGWSVRLVHEMVADLYTGRRRSRLAVGAAPATTPTPYKALVQYIVSLEQQQQLLLQQPIPTYAAFWRSQLQGFRSSTQTLFPAFPSADYRPLTDSVIELTLPLPPKPRSNNKNNTPTTKVVTISTLLRAAYAVVLAAQTHTTDICFGAVQAGRSIALPGISELVGPAITLVPVRIRWNDASSAGGGGGGGTTVRSFLETIQDQSTAMIPYEHVAKPRIAALGPDCAAASAYRCLLIVQPASSPGPASAIHGVTPIKTKYPEFLEYGLSLECRLAATEMVVHADYDRTVLGPEEVSHVIRLLGTALGWLAGEDEMGMTVGQLVRRLREE